MLGSPSRRATHGRARHRLLLHGQEFCTNKMIVTYAHRSGSLAGQAGGWMAVFFSLTDGRASAAGILRTSFCAGNCRQGSCERHVIHHKSSPITCVLGCSDQMAQPSFAYAVFSLNPSISSSLNHLFMEICAAGARVKCNTLGVKSQCLLNTIWEGR